MFNTPKIILVETDIGKLYLYSKCAWKNIFALMMRKILNNHDIKLKKMLKYSLG